MNEQKIHLQSYFGFTKIPFTKYMWASKMFDASAQRELIEGLNLWLETRGIALLYGPAGVGKSITLRRFKEALDQRRYDLFYLFNLRITPTGFLRSLCRILGLPLLYHQADLFDSVSTFLAQYEERSAKHPILIFDDGDGLSDSLLELLRLLANFSMDSEDRFSFILSGSQKLAIRLKQPQNEAFRQRIVFAHNLRGFTIEDARNYIRFHMERAEGPKQLFSDAAVQLIFHLAKGLPRVINQIALQAIIRAAIRRTDTIDENFLKQQVLNNSLFDHKLEEESS
jgi:type II secretory pathway predicted ATPase ExeA